MNATKVASPSCMRLLGRSLCDTKFPTQLGRWFPVQKDGATEIEDEMSDIRMLTADIALLRVSVLFCCCCCCCGWFFMR